MNRSPKQTPFCLATLLLALLLCATVQGQPAEPLLVVDPGGHQGIIRDLLVTADGRTLVSASADKTIRVWDTRRKREVRKILGQIGPGPEGKIYTIALSPDDRWLAVGGYLDTPGGNVGQIRLYDFASGTFKRLLKSHTNVVNDLAFSVDGRWLVSGSYDHTVKVWDARRGFRLARTLKGHKRHVYAVGMLPSGEVVSVGDDHQVLLWGKDQPIARYRHTHQLHYLAISPHWIAVSGYQQNYQILLFNHRLELKKTLHSDTAPTGLAFSPSGRWLLAGSGSAPFNCLLYDSQNGFQQQARFSAHDNVVMAVTFLNETTAVTGGGGNRVMRFWDRRGQEQNVIAGVGRRVWAVGLDAEGLSWGNSYETSPQKYVNPLEQRFALEDAQLGTVKGSPSRIATRWRGWSLSHRGVGDYGYDDATLVIEHQGQEQASITRGSTDGYRHRSYGFTSDGRIISGGVNGFLAVYDRLDRGQCEHRRPGLGPRGVHQGAARGAGWRSRLQSRWQRELQGTGPVCHATGQGADRRAPETDHYRASGPAGFCALGALVV